MIDVEKTDQVVKLTLCREERRNALSIRLMEELIEQVKEVEADESVRVLQIAGKGCFCSGLDLYEATNHTSIEKSAALLKELLFLLHASRKITVAKVEKAVIAGGVGLMAAVDIPVVAENTKMGLPEVRRGLVPALIIALLQRKMNKSLLRDLVYTGRILLSQEAVCLGWIHRVVPEKELTKETDAVIEAILQGAPGALLHSKVFLEELEVRPFLDELKLADQVHRIARESKEAKEGIVSFFEKRDPVW